MDERTRILKLGQSIYLAKNNRYNDVEDEEEDEFIAQTIDWVNQWVDEFELEANWNFMRRNRADLGAVTAGMSSLPIPSNVRTLVVSPYRSAVISHDGAIVSRFQLVNPNQITAPADEGLVEDRATMVGGQVLFSREFTDLEEGGHLLLDVIDYIPRLSLEAGQESAEMLDLIKPQALIVLGATKNSTLPDIVQGGTSPSHTQKYNDLLQKAILENNRTSEVDVIEGEDFGFIRGVW